MTHTPPIPAGNQSPYPLQEAPHKAKVPAPASNDPRVARTPDTPTIPVGTVVALAAGLGLAIAGGLFLALRGEAKPQKAKGKKRKAG